MKPLVLGTALCVVVGCGGTGGVETVEEQASTMAGLPTEIVLRHGEEKRVDGGILRLSFNDVLEDSRCPTDVTCVWEGNARVRIGIAAGTGPTHPLELNSTQDPRFADWNAVRVTLLEVSPDPVSTEQIPVESYLVRLRVESAR